MNKSLRVWEKFIQLSYKNDIFPNCKILNAALTISIRDESSECVVSWHAAFARLPTRSSARKSLQPER